MPGGHAAVGCCTTTVAQHFRDTKSEAILSNGLSKRQYASKKHPGNSQNHAKSTRTGKGEQKRTKKRIPKLRVPDRGEFQGHDWVCPKTFINLSTLNPKL